MGGETHIWPSVPRKSRFSLFPTSRPSLLYSHFLPSRSSLKRSTSVLSPPFLTYGRGRRSTTGPAVQVAHARARPRGSMTTPWSPGIELSHPPPAPFSSPRLRSSFRQARDRLGGPGTIETARCSPRRALGGALCSRLRRKASPASLSEGLDVPKRPALSPQTAVVSMVASPSLAAILQGGTLNLERLEQGFEAEL